MKLGFFTLADNTPLYGAYQISNDEIIRRIIDQAVIADALGFHSFWFPEHHGGGYCISPSPGILIGHTTARTKQIRLGAACVVLPVNQPLRVAAEYALLDQLSNGRVVLALGRGYSQDEYSAFGVSFDDSRELLEEGVQLIRAAWTEKPFTFCGKHLRVKEQFELNQYPQQSPHPDLYLALWSKGTMELAARLGMNIIFTPFAAQLAFGGIAPAVKQYRSRISEHGHAGPMKILCSYYCAVAGNEADTRAHRERLLRLLKALIPSLPEDTASLPPHFEYLRGITRTLTELRADDLGDSSIATGTPEKIVEILKGVEQNGIDEVLLNIDFGGATNEQVQWQLKQLAEHVLPHF